MAHILAHTTPFDGRAATESERLRRGLENEGPDLAPEKDTRAFYVQEIIPLRDRRQGPEEGQLMRSIEICAGAGGQALGLEQAGFVHAALIENDKHACATLRLNRPHWNILEMDVRHFSARAYENIDLLAGGVPCPPFSVAGKQLGHEDDRDLFPEALRLIKECNPKAVMLENVKGLFSPKFEGYRANIVGALERLGYTCFWELLHASDFGVSQLRPRTVLIALKRIYAPYFSWPAKNTATPRSVGELLYEEMASRGWAGAKDWARKAGEIAPTLVGGSKKHGGPDLGPTRAKHAWEKLGVDGRGIAEQAPEEHFTGNPKLTVNMAAMIQGFGADWHFAGSKTAAYRQVGNAFPPPVAKALGDRIQVALTQGSQLETGGSYGRREEEAPALFA